MKFKNILFGVFILLFSQSCASQNISIPNNNIDSTKVYQNVEYAFKVNVPNDWEIYREVVNNPLRKYTYIDWATPPVYSEIKKTEIDNSISIQAFIKKSITEVGDLILSEYLKSDPTKTALEAEKGIGVNARIIYHTAPNGDELKGKAYYRFKNGICYVITLMGTPDTYDKNLEKFEEFFLTLKLE